MWNCPFMLIDKLLFFVCKQRSNTNYNIKFHFVIYLICDKNNHNYLISFRLLNVVLDLSDEFILFFKYANNNILNSHPKFIITQAYNNQINCIKFCKTHSFFFFYLYVLNQNVDCFYQPIFWTIEKTKSE